MLSNPENASNPENPLIVLIHGAWHDGTCWNPLVAELARRERRILAPSLPADNPNAGFAEYADELIQAIGGEREVVLVAHSLGGLTAPLIASAVNVRSIVYLCALLPSPGLSLQEQLATETHMMTQAWWTEYFPRQVRNADGTTEWPVELGAEVFYHDADAAELDEALKTLRKQGERPIFDKTPLQAWPEVRNHYILATGDRVVSPDWSRESARARLGVEPIEIEGGHSPFRSRPVELADYIETLCFDPESVA